MQLNGKTILFLGSSVTYGWASDGVSFVDLLAAQCGAHCIKEAVSGTTLADRDDRSYVARLKKVDQSTKLDLLVCQLSTNDAKKRLPLSEIEAAIRYIADYTRTSFGCPLVFYTNTYFESDVYQEMITLLYRLQAEYGFSVLDLYRDPAMQVDEATRATYMRDAIHPTLLGYRDWWLPKFIAFFETLPC